MGLCYCSVIPLFLFLIFIFWLHCEACRILVLWPGMESVPPVVEVQNPNRWTVSKVLSSFLIFSSCDGFTYPVFPT